MIIMRTSEATMNGFFTAFSLSSDKHKSSTGSLLYVAGQLWDILGLACFAWGQPSKVLFLTSLDVHSEWHAWTSLLRSMGHRCFYSWLFIKVWKRGFSYSLRFAVNESKPPGDRLCIQLPVILLFLLWVELDIKHSYFAYTHLYFQLKAIFLFVNCTLLPVMLFPSSGLGYAKREW